ncbi:serine/threonine protein kinase [Kineococcus xinjiangensis]|uniref:Serine/threonine protein kinase n=1 Tax=Kineococcus xinjiangensis TaxID=512762 RepID=A0A2S6IC11_9ACTN|nr:serine/threonine-protein kinase [Kineococcus xinjiangensis]PPK90789.1 serine/threonine protein kinase [Kineococcus xinjiangensis]
MQTPAPFPHVEPVTSPVPTGDGRTGAAPSGGPAPGTTLGEHRLLHVIGEGGMGIVYLALDAGQRAVALKVLKPHVAGDPHARERLDREVSTLERVRSPRVAEVLGGDVCGQWPYLVTRYVPGRPLDTVVAADGPLTGRALHELGHGLSEALAAIHGAGVVHRDLKPGNVLVLDGKPVVIDFGIAHVADDVRLTTTGLVMGTPGYLSPEVVGGGAVSPATDWWGWAATVAFAATGRPPFGRGPMEVVLDRVRRGEADLAGLPPELSRLLSAALAVNPSHRPEPEALLQALDRACRAAGDSSPVTSAVPVLDRDVVDVRDTVTPPGGTPAFPPAVDGDATRVVAVDRRSPFESRTGLEVDGSHGWASRRGDFRPRQEGPRTVDPRDAALLREAATPRPEPESAAERTSVLPPIRHVPPAEQRPPVHQAPPHQPPSAQRFAPPPEQHTSVLPPVRPHPQRPAAPHGPAPRPGGPAPAAFAPQERQPWPPQPQQPAGWGPPASWPPAAAPAPAGQAFDRQAPAGQRFDRQSYDGQAPGGAAPAPAGQQAARPARTGTLLAMLIALAGVCAVAPTAGCVLALIGATLARTVDRSHGTLARRREAAGPRPSDALAVAVAAPWNALRSAVSTLFWSIIPALVGVSTLFIAGLVPGLPTGGPDAPFALGLGALAAALTAWWGPGSRSLQRGTRAIVRTVTGGEQETKVVVAVLGLVAVSAVFMALNGAEPDWRPLGGSPFTALLY